MFTAHAHSGVVGTRCGGLCGLWHGHECPNLARQLHQHGTCKVGHLFSIVFQGLIAVILIHVRIALYITIS